MASQNNDSLKVFESRQKYPGRFIALKPDEVKAIIKYPNGRGQLWEFYRGSTFQSQSSRSLRPPSQITDIHFFDNFGRETRKISRAGSELSKK